MARAGALVSIGQDGSAQIDRGLVRPEDQEPEAKAAKAAAAPGGMTAALVTDLSAHRTAALRVALAGNPAVALAAVAHALALPLLYEEHHASCLALRASSEPLDRHTKAPGDCRAHDALDRAGRAWRDRLPGDPFGLLAWCLAQEQATLLDLLAYLAALSVDAVEIKHRPRPPASGDLARAVALDLRDHWQPTIEGFWQRLSKAGMVEALAEAEVTAAGPLASVKKAEAAAMAARAMQGSGWLPAPLRETDA